MLSKIRKDYDFVVVGGGISGVCAAISAARHGMKTALIQDRAVLGGNASSEIRVNINGAGRHGEFPNLRETGIVLEIQHETKRRNPHNSFNILDTVLWEKCSFQENLDLYLNTSCVSAETENNKITSIKAYQATTSTEFEFTAKMFADTSGDAVLAYESGAQWTLGREAKETYNESYAPEVANKYTMGSTVMFFTKDMGKPVPFKRPDWAYEFTAEKLGDREIKELNHGYWWVELGGDDNLAVIEDSETIRDELYKWAFGVFDYIKNSGKYNADNLVIDWICSTPGRRESRRIIGDYVLTQNDCYEGKRFADAIAYGGWSMDDHSVGGINAVSENEQGTQWLKIKEAYTIPYRSIYSKNIENLYVGGRCCSVSHMAMSSTRVIATCGVIGQAIGTAAAIAIPTNKTCRDINADIDLLQQTLIKDDCFIPGIKANDEADICPKCIITASSSVENGEASKIVNGFDRDIGEDKNAWVSEKISENGEWIKMELPKTQNISEVLIKFDPNLTKLLSTSAAPKTVARQVPDMPYELVSDYKVEAFLNGEIVFEETVIDNLQRLQNIKIGKDADTVKITIQKTHGDDNARIFEVRIY